MMKRTMLRLLCLAVAAFAFAPHSSAQSCPLADSACAKTAPSGWIQLFDGYSLDGWKQSEDNRDAIRLAGGSIVCNGNRSHLYYDGEVLDHNFRNFVLEVDVMTKENSNGGIFIHTEYQAEGWPNKGYEIQVNNSFKNDPRKTGSIWDVCDTTETFVQDDEWYTQRIMVLEDHVTVYLINKQTGQTTKVIDFIEPADRQPPKKLSSGTFALQAHDPGSTVYYTNIRVRPLPDLPEWKPLFNGENLEGWVQRNGTAKYEIENGEIVGTTVEGSPNSFLCTEKDYADFELEFDTMVDPRLNAGVQIRSKSLDIYNKGRVHGYQVEIDPSERAWSGGIYDEARRAWLYNLKDDEAAQKAFKNNEWNTYRVLCVGDSIRTWVNGVPCADLKDGMTPSGFIALQVHGFKGETPAQIRWKNIRVRDLSPACSQTTSSCPKAEDQCPKAKCDKADGQCCKAEGQCPKAKCDKADGQCCKAEGQCPKAKCDKAGCQCCKAEGQCPKAKCDKSDGQCCKAEGQCPKAKCNKADGQCCKAEGQCPKAKCDKADGQCCKAEGQCPKAKCDQAGCQCCKAEGQCSQTEGQCKQDCTCKA